MVSDERIANDDLKNGILMLQTALWAEYRSVSTEHHDDHRYTIHAFCQRCRAAWTGDPTTKPERHESWCPLSWTPDIDALAAAQAEIAALKDAVERLAGGYDVLCEYGVIPAQYVDEARALADEARALLAPDPQGASGGEG